MEFTRLAQITKEAKYYDAIARITNELEIWQNNTNLPGMWPISVDASGCKKPEMKTTPTEQMVLNGGESSLHEPASAEAVRSGRLPHTPDLVDLPNRVSTSSSQDPAKSEIQIGTDLPEVGKAHKVPIEKVPTVDDVAPARAQLGRRQLPDEDFAATQTPKKPNVPKPSLSRQPNCEAQGLSTPPKTGSEEFSLGGRSDSTYEYLPKEYMLLGGLEDKYRTMYEQSIKAVKTHLLYRPMIPGDRNILFSGSARVKVTGKTADVGVVRLMAEATHLTCFAGGMFAVGARIFGHEADMDIAAKLTDGCVWAYESTTTGIMPEDATLISCKDRDDCAWNKTRWREALDPYREGRERSRLMQIERAREAEEQALLDGDSKLEAPLVEDQIQQAVLPATLPVAPAELPKPAEALTLPTAGLRKRQVGLVEKDLSDGTSTKEAEGFAGSPTQKVPQQKLGTNTAPTGTAEDFAGRSTQGVSQQDTENDVAPARAVEDFTGIPIKKTSQQDTGNDVAPARAVEDSTGTPTQKTSSQQNVEKSAEFDKKTETVEGYVKTVGDASGAAAKSIPSGGKSIPISPPSPAPIVTHEQFVEDKIKNERLPPGFINMRSKKYILRYVNLESGSSLVLDWN